MSEAGRQHCINKPFSDAETPRMFMDLGAIFSLLPPAPARVLECGCGTGWLTYFLGRKGYEVVGQDCSPDAIELARANPPFTGPCNVGFICSDFEGLGYRDEFDAIVFYGALHHSQDIEKAIQSAYQALRPNGVFVAVEPGMGHERRSRKIIEEYDVGDRDMPPVLVMRHGRAAGFRETKAYQHAGQLCSTVFNELPHSNFLKRVWQVPGARFCFLLASLLFFKRYNGTVWMRK